MPAKSPIRRRSGYARRSPSSASRSGYAKRSPTPATRKSKDPCAALKLKLKERDAELKESRAQQAAVSDILRVISGTATDVKPVLRSIAEHAMRLCQSLDARIWLVEGDQQKYITGCGRIAYAKEGETRPRDRTSGSGRAIVDRKVVHIRDAASVPQKEFSIAREMQRRHGHRTVLAVPLMLEKRALGAITLRKLVVEPFTKRQIELVRTFADQAAIAIENVRLFSETREALEHQTATSEILRIISSSPTDTQPVFDAIVKSGVQLFGNVNVGLRLVKGDQTALVASTLGLVGSGVVGSDVPISLSDDRFPAHRAVLQREVVHVPDIPTEDWLSEHYKQRAERRGYRAVVSAPMLRENNTVGVINVNRATPGPFTERQIALVKTFADQAVIAIENVRLFKELQAKNADLTEALEQQTATSEILRVIASSPTELKPVLDVVAENAARLCDAVDALILRPDGDNLRVVGKYGGMPVPDVLPFTRGFPAGRAVLNRQTIHVHDIAAEIETEYPDAKVPQRASGTRTVIYTPLLREGLAIGCIGVRRTEVRPFSEKQITLLKTFADQAVIAIENVRLFKELQARNAEITEALEQQTATAEILKVISSSPTDLKPVFDAILENATRLCDAHMANLSLYDGETTLTVAQRGGSAEYAKWIMNRGPVRFAAGGNVTRMIAERRPISPTPTATRAASPSAW